MKIKDAFLLLHDWWKDARKTCDCGCGKTVTDQNPRAAGLCACINILIHRGAITETQGAMMRRMIPENNGKFVWPTTREGAKDRAEFCEQAAGRC